MCDKKSGFGNMLSGGKTEERCVSLCGCVCVWVGGLVCVSVIESDQRKNDMFEG